MTLVTDLRIRIRVPGDTDESTLDKFVDVIEEADLEELVEKVVNSALQKGLRNSSIPTGVDGRSSLDFTVEVK